MSLWGLGRTGLGRSSDVTTTAAFKRWFGESVIVTPDGAPRVVYHGTKARLDFNTFRFPEDEIGVHFGTIEQASEFVKETKKWGENYSPRIYPVYLRLENPLRMNDLGSWTASRMANSLIQMVPGSLYEEVTQDRRLVDWFPGQPKREAGLLKMIGYLKRKGYDGIVYVNTEEGPGDQDSYIVFDPTQIKSASGNQGTFDPNDPNILHGLRRSRGLW